MAQEPTHFYWKLPHAHIDSLVQLPTELDILHEHEFYVKLAGDMWAKEGAFADGFDREHGAFLCGCELTNAAEDMLAIEVYTDCTYIQAPSLLLPLLEQLFNRKPQWRGVG